ncbi:hypothetical protein [Ferruginibacter sp.]
MKTFFSTAIILALSVPLFSFNDFIDYWTVKLNGKLIYDSMDDRKYNKVHLYTVSIKDIKATDTLEVEYFTDTQCAPCIHTYLISEFTDTDGKADELMGTYLKEQKFLKPKPYKISLTDVLNCGTPKTIKSIFYYINGTGPIQELCRINFK